MFSINQLSCEPEADLFPACAATRAMSRANANDNQEKTDS